MLHYACKSRHLEVAKLLLEQMTRDAVLSLNLVSAGRLGSVQQDLVCCMLKSTKSFSGFLYEVYFALNFSCLSLFNQFY